MELNLLSLFCIITLLIYNFNFIKGQIIYDFDVNEPAQNYTETAGGLTSQQLKFNYFPQRTSPAIGTLPSYTFFPLLDPPPIPQFTWAIRDKHRLVVNNSIWAQTWNPNDWSPPLNGIKNLYQNLTTLIIPEGYVLNARTFTGMNCAFPSDSNVVNKYAMLVKGTLIFDPTVNVDFHIQWLHVYPTGKFVSRPNKNVKHTFTLFANRLSGDGTFGNANNFIIFRIDPFLTGSLVVLGGTLDLQGDNTQPSFIGIHGDTLSSRGSPLTAGSNATGYIPGTNITRMDRQSEDFYSYYLASLTTTVNGVYNASSQTFAVPNSYGAGYVNLLPNARNIIFQSQCTGNIIITSNATVTIDSVLFRGLGFTTNAPINNTKIKYSPPEAPVPFDFDYLGWNQEDRYGITLLHVKTPVVINNCIFDSTGGNTRFMLAARRSYGKITNNGFIITNRNTSGIGLLHGTENFEIRHNGFISLLNPAGPVQYFTYDSYRYQAPTWQSRNATWPDIGCINCAIYSTSPYTSNFTQNIIEGGWIGGGSVFEPIQGRIGRLNLTTELLYGDYAGIVQDNSDFNANSAWQPFLYDRMYGNYFVTFGDNRLVYNMSYLPSLVFRQHSTYFIRTMTTANINASNNVHYVFESCLIGCLLDVSPTSRNRPVNLIAGSIQGLSFTDVTAYKVTDVTLLGLKIGYVLLERTDMMDYGRPPNVYPNADHVYFHEARHCMEMVINAGYVQQTYEPHFDTITTLAGLNYNITQKFVVPQGPYAQFQLNTTSRMDGIETWGLYNNYVNITQITTPVTIPPVPGYHLMMSHSNPLVGDALWVAINHGTIASTILVRDLTPTSFYFGIDISANISSTRRVAINGFGGKWTKCQYINTTCSLSGGSLGAFNQTPTSMTDQYGQVQNLPSLMQILSSYYIGSQTKLTLNLVPGEYQIVLYFTNPLVDPVGFTSTSRLHFQIKMNGKLQQTPLIYRVAQSLQYTTSQLFFFNNYNSTSVNVEFEWGFTGATAALSGVAVYSNHTSPLPIPDDPPPTTPPPVTVPPTQPPTTATTTTTTTTATATTTTTTTTDGTTTSSSTTSPTTGNQSNSSSTPTTFVYHSTGNHPSSSSKISFNYSLLFFIISFIIIIF